MVSTDIEHAWYMSWAHERGYLGYSVSVYEKGMSSAMRTSECLEL